MGSRLGHVATASMLEQDAAGISADGSSEEASSSSSSMEEPEFPELRLQLPPPTNAQVKTAEFVKSSVTVPDCPPPKYPEFAVIGRSNVGKSSLINLLTNRKSLAMVSKQPGGRGWCCSIVSEQQLNASTEKHWIVLSHDGAGVHLSMRFDLHSICM